MWRPRDRERFIGSYDPEHEMPDPDRDAGDRWQSGAYRHHAHDSRYAYRMNPDFVERQYEGDRGSRRGGYVTGGDYRDRGPSYGGGRGGNYYDRDHYGYGTDRDSGGYGRNYDRGPGNYDRDRGGYGATDRSGWDRGGYGNYDRGPDRYSGGGYSGGDRFSGGGGYNAGGYGGGGYDRGFRGGRPGNQQWDRSGTDRGWDSGGSRWESRERGYDDEDDRWDSGDWRRW